MFRSVCLSCVLLVLAVDSALAQTNQSEATPTSDKVSFILSTEDRKAELAEQPALKLVPIESATRDLLLPVIEIDPTRTGQKLLGLGGSLDHASCFNLSKLPKEKRDEIIAKYVDPQVGIGMNLFRLCIGTSDFVGEPYYTYCDLAAGDTDPQLMKFSIEKDRAYVLPIIKEVLQKNPKVLFIASPWSPPAWMKSNGKLGKGSVNKEFYPAYARYLLKYLQAYQAEGIAIHALTVQNEPHMTHDAYPTTEWQASDQRDFIRDHLGPLFEANKITTKIWCWDHNWNKPEFPRTILSDAQAARFVDGTAFHHYEGEVEAQSTIKKEFPSKDIYFTEGSVFRSEGAVRLTNILRHHARSYNAWVIFLDQHRKPNRGPHPASATIIELLDDGGTQHTFDYFSYGQFMKYLPRDSVRLESTNALGDKFGNVAFKLPDGSFTLVTANANKDPRTFVVKCQNRLFKATLPATSVATFCWK